MTNPYSSRSTNTALPPHSFRRPSYASVAASSAIPGGITRERERLREREREREIAMAERGDRLPQALVLGSTGVAGWPRSVSRPGSSGKIEGERERRAERDWFTPSYLRGCRYVARLRRQWEEELKERERNAAAAVRNGVDDSGRIPGQKQHSIYHSGGPGRTTASAVGDVIERLPPASSDDDSTMRRLPSRWSDDDKLSGLELLADGLEVRHVTASKNTPDDAASIRADNPMPRACGLFYYEVTILSRGKEGLVGIGFSTKRASLNRLPGWEHDSWAYHGDDGYAFACSASGKPYASRFGANDVIGVGVDLRKGEAWFTKNGFHLGVAFTNVKAEDLYPSVGMKRAGEHLRVNFGRTPFVYDIDSHVERERKAIMTEISHTDVSGLHPPDDENTLIHNLVAQYLAHEGYVETAKAFASDVRNQHASLSGPLQQPALQVEEEEEDVHAVHRQRIRKSILDGDIDRSLKYLNSYFPRVLEDARNREIYFQLKCRKFVEMMRRYSDLVAAASAAPKEDAGHAESDADDDAEEGEDTQMDLDAQLRPSQVPTDDVDMTNSLPPSPTKTALKKPDLLPAILSYGRELQAEFGADERPGVRKELTELFAIIAYPDPRDSPIAGLLERDGRVALSEGVNGAILVSLGKPPAAALEKLAAQTEVLLDEVAAKTGGDAAFVNVANDFLKG